MSLLRLAAPAMLALTTPLTVAHADPRVATRPYVADAVVTLQGRMGYSATIAFADDERIENVAVGDSAAWQVTPNRRANLLFVKPVTARARTNMTVVTDRRTYMFDLVSTAAIPAASTIYMLRFRYPAEPKPASAVLSGEAARPAPEPIPAVPAATPPTLNFGWRAEGSTLLLPARSFDDGQSTYLEWAADAVLPAILTREGKNEGPVNFTVQDGVIVIDGVPPLIVLRSGKLSATLTRNAPAPALPSQSASAAR